MKSVVSPPHWLALRSTKASESPRRAEAPERHPSTLLLTAAGCALFAALFWHPRAYLFLALVVTLLVIGVAAPLAATRSLRVSLLRGRRRGRVGEPLAAKFVVTNRWLIPVRGLMLGCGNRPAEVAVASVGPRRSKTIDAEMTPDRRGPYPSRGIVVQTGAPLGVLTSTRRFDAEPVALIWPEIVDLLGDAETAHANGPDRRRSQQSGAEGEALAPRPYRPGESVRRVHWPQSARKDELIVCEFEAERPASIALRLDLAPRSVAGDAATEAAVAIAASVASACATYPGGLTFESPDGRAFRVKDLSGVGPLLDCLAIAEPTDSPPRLRRDRAHADDSVLVTTRSAGDARRPSETTLVVVDRDRGVEPALWPGDRSISASDWRSELLNAWAERRG